MTINTYKAIGAAFFSLALLSCNEAKKSNVDYVDPTIGNIAPLLNTNRPVVQLPNQIVRMFPKRQDHLDMQITDFPLLSQNIITPQVIFAVKPSIGEVTDTAWYRRLTFDHDFEVTKPYYYSVRLTDDHVLLEYTAGAKTGIYRFTYPEGVKKNVLLSHYYPNGRFEWQDDHTIVGQEFIEDAIHTQKGTAFFYGELSGTPETGKKQGEKFWGKYTVGNNIDTPTKVDGERAYASYAEGDNNSVEFRYAISFISIEQAKENFKAELDNITFQQLADKGKAEWEKVLGQIEVEGGTEAQRRTFYTSLYRFYARMNDMSEGGKYFSYYDSAVHEDAVPFYTDDYTWGNYQAMHPLRAILDPKLEADMLQSYVRMYEQSGWMPEYPKPFGDRPGMFAFHSSVMFLDAYRKGIRDFNVSKALEGMLNNADHATMLPFRNGPRGGLEKFYDKAGYYPGLKIDEVETDSFAILRKGQVRSSVAITLGDAYDSWALSELANELGNKEVYERFKPKAQNYKNLWYEPYQLFMPKDSNGEWVMIDPKFGGGHNGFDYYNENNGWSYKWNVQHDIKGLAGLLGGPDKLEEHLDQLFREGLGRSKPTFLEMFPNSTGMIGQFSIGNQATYFIPYLFNYTSAPWKTQKYTRLILDIFFPDHSTGVPGDEDAGALSSWVVFSAMGFYPVTPGVPEYAITSPLFSKVTIHLDNGKDFTLIAKGCSRTNKYIQSAKMNGKELNTLWFSHEDLMNGGTLELEMGEDETRRWDVR